jgi:hypothetical protein
VVVTTPPAIPVVVATPPAIPTVAVEAHAVALVPGEPSIITLTFADLSRELKSPQLELMTTPFFRGLVAKSKISGTIINWVNSGMEYITTNFPGAIYSAVFAADFRAAVGSFQGVMSVNIKSLLEKEKELRHTEIKAYLAYATSQIGAGTKSLVDYRNGYRPRPQPGEIGAKELGLVREQRLSWNIQLYTLWGKSYQLRNDYLARKVQEDANNAIRYEHILTLMKEEYKIYVWVGVLLEARRVETLYLLERLREVRV